MGRDTPEKPFKDKKKLAEMLELLKAGHSYSFLGKKYRCDTTTIYYYVLKYGIVADFEIRRRKIRESSKWKVNSRGELINIGKSYKDYQAKGREKKSTLQIAREKSGSRSI